MDEPILDATAPPAADPIPAATPAVDPTPDASHPDPLAPVVNDDDAMWGDLKEDPPAAPDANAAAPAIAPELTRVFESSNYVKSMEHIPSAVQTAGEVWDISTGRAKASNLLEQLQSVNPAVFEAQLNDNLIDFMIPHIERIRGQKFGAPPADDPDRPMTRAEYEQAQRDSHHKAQVEQATQAQQRERQGHIDRFNAASQTKIEEYIKGGNGIFDGDVDAAINSVGAQLPKLGIGMDDLMKQVLAGNITNLEKAYKAAEKAETLKAKAYSDRIRAKFKTLKASVPATKGSAGAINPASEAQDLTTASGRAKAMAEAFKAGRDTI